MRWRRSSVSQQDVEIFEIPAPVDGIIQVCHPQWRGVRASAIAYGDPVLESDDLTQIADSIDEVHAAGVSMIVIQGWPPGAHSKPSVVTGTARRAPSNASGGRAILSEYWSANTSQATGMTTIPKYSIFAHKIFCTRVGDEISSAYAAAQTATPAIKTTNAARPGPRPRP